MNIVKILFLAGVSLIALSAVVFIIQKAGLPFGRLPGDIHMKNENSSLYFPIVSCIVVSILLSLMINLFKR